MEYKQTISHSNSLNRDRRPWQKSDDLRCLVRGSAVTSDTPALGSASHLTRSPSHLIDSGGTSLVPQHVILSSLKSLSSLNLTYAFRPSRKLLDLT